MTKISLRDVRRHDAEETTETLYSPQKCKASYELSLKDRRVRGEQLERIIADLISRECNVECTALKGNQPYDITANFDGGPKRIEVKSALYKSDSPSSYHMVNIKPKYFDYLFIVLVTPTATVLKWADVKDVREACKHRSRHCNGYALCFKHDNIPDYFYDLEDFPYSKKYLETQVEQFENMLLAAVEQ